MQPVWLNIVRLDQVDENADIDVAQLDHLSENEALFGIIKDKLHDYLGSAPRCRGRE
jgi:hypothetical protein